MSDKGATHDVPTQKVFKIYNFFANVGQGNRHSKCMTETILLKISEYKTFV